MNSQLRATKRVPCYSTYCLILLVVIVLPLHFTSTAGIDYFKKNVEIFPIAFLRRLKSISLDNNYHNYCASVLIRWFISFVFQTVDDQNTVNHFGWGIGRGIQRAIMRR